MNAAALEAEARRCHARLRARLRAAGGARAWMAAAALGWCAWRSWRRGWRALAFDAAWSLFARGEGR